jgi:hypothetical protein
MRPSPRSRISIPFDPLAGTATTMSGFTSAQQPGIPYGVKSIGDAIGLVLTTSHASLAG